MIVDTSAVVAIFLQEPGFEYVLEQLIDADQVGIGSPTLVECAIVLSARMGNDSRALLSRFLEELAITAVPFTETHYQTAVGAWLKFGKGRHPAGLNFGDCLAYATAKIAKLPLLCVGDDFRQTDVTVA
jgi:ribonuclease VapC